MSVLEARTVIRVGDFNKSLEFYKDVLNWEIVESWSKPNDQGAVFRVGDALLEILAQGKGEPYDLLIPNGKVTLAFWFDDVVKLYSELLSKHLKIEPPMMSFPWGDKGFGIVDPDGMQLMFFQHQT